MVASTVQKRWLAVGWVLMTGCVVANEQPLEDGIAVGGLDAKEDVTRDIPWSASDAPSIFGTDLRSRIDELPRQGAAAQAPWAGSYWPVYMDSINHKWEGEGSEAPSTKYARAYNVTGVEDAVSRMRGIAGQSSRKACKLTSECNAQVGEECAIRAGEESGRCVPTWFGICHAWAPASILVPEPKHPVTVNGVTFKVNDIKALVTLAHDRVENRFVSLRCNADDGQSKIEYDAYGRPRSGDCIDTNPGTFHLLIGNFLGLKGQSFVMDRTFDDEVWNQPLRAYRITALEEIDAARANALVGVQPEGGTTLQLGAQLRQGQWKHFDPVTVAAGSTLKVVMRGDGDGDLYVHFGNQPTESTYACRPFDNGSEETCELAVPAGATQAFVSVHGYAEASTVTLEVFSGGVVAPAYQFNANARRFYEVRTEVDYIAESSITTDGNLADRIDVYTHTDRYHYVLEAAEDGQILGGEWLGESKRNHPDFLWLPVRVGSQSVAEGKITYPNVMDLLNRSLTTNEEAPPTTVTVQESGTVTRGAFTHFGPFPAAAGSMLVANLTGTGDADLYVRRGAAPTLESHDCRPYENGSTESCSVEGPGDLYVAVHGYATSSDFNLSITYTRGGGSTPPTPPAPSVEHLNVTGDVAQGQFSFHTLNVVAGQAVVVRTQASKDVDLYLQMGQQPSTGSYLARGYTSSGNETLTFTATAAGTLHIGVHGYEASAFTLTTADQ